MGYKKFRDKIKKVSGPRKHKVRNSYGIYDGYKYYRKNKPNDKKYVLTESEYFAITRRINNLLSEEISNSTDVILPKQMGRIELRKYDKNISFDEDGKIKTNLPVDWDKTLKLWFEDEESLKEKKLVRVDSDEIFTIYYNKGKANFGNKSFYEFRVNRDLKKRVKNKIASEKIDALQLGKNFKYGK